MNQRSRDEENLVPDAVTAYTVKEDLTSSIIKNMISVRGHSIALEGSIIQ